MTFNEMCNELYEERAKERDRFIENALGFIRDADIDKEFVPMVGRLIRKTILEVPFDKWTLVNDVKCFYSVEDVTIELFSDGWTRIIRKSDEAEEIVGRYQFGEEITYFMEELRIFEITTREEKYEDELVSCIYKLIER